MYVLLTYVSNSTKILVASQLICLIKKKNNAYIFNFNFNLNKFPGIVLNEPSLLKCFITNKSEKKYTVLKKPFGSILEKKII